MKKKINKIENHDIRVDADFLNERMGMHQLERRIEIVTRDLPKT
ncbi:unnamed protein product, partial [Vitis vinifera]